jgi:hypothetical protein
MGRTKDEKMPRSKGRPPSEGTPYPIKPYLSAEQIEWLNAQPNKSAAIVEAIALLMANQKA